MAFLFSTRDLQLETTF